MVQLRNALNEKGGTPEVLDFLSIVNQMKIKKSLTREDIDRLNLADICSLARQSKYCPIHLNRIINEK